MKIQQCTALVDRTPANFKLELNHSVKDIHTDKEFVQTPNLVAVMNNQEVMTWM